MIIKYDEYIKESLSTKYKIKDWLDRMYITDYTINDDLSIDVDGDIDINNKKLTKIPVNFNKVNGSFNCSYNNLTSLKGCPIIVNGHFNCSSNELTNLKDSPTIVNGTFGCYDNKLTNLKDSPNIIIGSFYCYKNKLTSLKGCPNTINDYFDCTFNQNLVNINDLDSKILIKNINSIEVSEEVFDKYFECWIDKDSNIFNVLKNKVSDTIKQKYSHLFQANNFDLL